MPVCFPGTWKTNTHAFPSAKAKGEKSYATKKPRISSQEVLGYLNELEARTKAKYPDVKSRTITAFQQDFEKELITTGGAHCYSLLARSYVVVTMSMDSESGPVEIRKIFGGIGQLEDTLPGTDEADRGLEETYKHLKNKSKGVAPQAGAKEVILDSKVAGILAHEAIGHTTEADLVMGGSVAGDCLNQVVASPLVSLVDYAHRKFNQIFCQ